MRHTACPELRRSSIGIDTSRVKFTAVPYFVRHTEVVFEYADFVTIALLVVLEGLLSADNAMVLAVLVLGLPKTSSGRRSVTAFSARSSSGPSRRSWPST